MELKAGEMIVPINIYLRMGTYSRNRRSLGSGLAWAQYDVHASESEIARDLQQLYQCSLAQASQFLQTEADSRPEIRAKVSSN